MKFVTCITVKTDHPNFTIKVVFLESLCYAIVINIKTPLPFRRNEVNKLNEVSYV